MPYNPYIHNRHSIRLEDYDYSLAGAYFVTACTYGRELTFDDPRFRLVVKSTWLSLPRHYRHAVLDVFVIMPNHVHGIIVLDEPAGAGFSDPGQTDLLDNSKPAPTGDDSRRHPLSEIVRFFKTYSARRINLLRHTEGTPFWQRNYREHIIRDERGLDEIRRYIADNPANWETDPENPRRLIEQNEGEFWNGLVKEGRLVVTDVE